MIVALNAGGAVVAGMVLAIAVAILREMRRLRADVALVEHHLGPNGHEELLPPELRNQSLRTIVSVIAAWRVEHEARTAQHDEWAQAQAARLDTLYALMQREDRR